MLRYRADLKTLLFVATYFGLVAAQWIFAPSELRLAIPLLVLTCWFSFFGAVATHNTVHCPVFQRRWQNRVFQVVLTLTYGHPVSAFVPGHNLSHHKHTQTRRDVMRTTKVDLGWNLLSILAFIGLPKVEIERMRSALAWNDEGAAGKADPTPPPAGSTTPTV